MNDLILKRPHITEKSATGADSATNPSYTFEVPSSTNKQEVAKAVAALYKVTPTRVNIVNIPSKSVWSRGKKGTRPGYKKAVVFLKKGDSIAFV